VPGEVLPLLVLKPLSGAASLVYTVDLMRRLGPDSFAATLACVSQSSFDTTFYVVSLYFGSVGVRNIRHTLLAALSGDMVGFLVALAVCRVMFGS
ncbi:MAG: spore maturation protein, partial [Firmicutes bacterium]|nr:spore maturation protein [Bacillota bacterium]